MARSAGKQSRKTPRGTTSGSKPGGARAGGTGAASASQAKRTDWVNLKVALPQPKQAISLRIDQDILTWFRDRGPGYQTRMNAVLRAFVDAQQGKR
ncbi:MAG TPA: BrnA antitoxin family protein [Acetobacteraceae bacterium]